MHFELINVNLFITIYQIFSNVSTDFVLFIIQLLTIFTPKLRFGNNFNLGWVYLQLQYTISYTVPPASVEPRASSLTLVI